jgi:hypothetical protein
MKKLILGLLTLTALGIASFPVHANEGDSAVVQDTRQTVYQTGNDNYGSQSTMQRNRIYQSGSREGSTGDVQTSDQLIDQYGSGNMVEQRVRQENVRKYKVRHGRSCNSGCDD